MTEEEFENKLSKELRDNEKVLWKTAIDPKKREDWIKSQIKGEKINAPTSFAVSVLFFWLAAKLFFEPGEQWSLWSALSDSILPFIFGALIFWSFLLFLEAYRKPESYYRLRRYSGYALTDQRFILITHIADENIAYPNPKFSKFKVIKDWTFRQKWHGVALFATLKKPQKHKMWHKQIDMYFLPDFEKAKLELDHYCSKGAKP